MEMLVPHQHSSESDTKSSAQSNIVDDCNSPQPLFHNVKKNIVRTVPNFDCFNYDQQLGRGSSTSTCEGSPVVRKRSSGMSCAAKDKHIKKVTPDFIEKQGSERIANVNACDVLFAMPKSSKFGGLKKRSQDIKKLSGMGLGADLHMSETIFIGNQEKIVNFQ